MLTPTCLATDIWHFFRFFDIWWRAVMPLPDVGCFTVIHGCIQSTRRRPVTWPVTWWLTNRTIRQLEWLANFHIFSVFFSIALFRSTGIVLRSIWRPSFPSKNFTSGVHRSRLLIINKKKRWAPPSVPAQAIMKQLILGLVRTTGEIHIWCRPYNNSQCCTQLKYSTSIAYISHCLVKTDEELSDNNCYYIAWILQNTFVRLIICFFVILLCVTQWATEPESTERIRWCAHSWVNLFTRGN